MNPIIAIIQRNILNYVRNKGRMIGSIVMALFMLVMFSFLMISAMTFSAIGLFLATISRNSPSFQTISSMAMMPLTFVSGAYIPTTIMPKFLLPVVYLNPLTYVTSIFRYISLGAYNMSMEELVKEGIAFNINGFIITPLMGLIFTILIGVFFFTICVTKFNKADFSTVKIAKVMRGGSPSA